MYRVFHSIRFKVNNSGLSGALFYALKIAYINFMMYLCSEVIIKEVDQNE